MQGWTPDFIPKITGDAVERHLYDELMAIPGPEAMAVSQRLAKEEGVFVGITSGATFAGALRIAERAAAGATILAMLPDTGERYLSTPLFADVPAEMTAEEIAIARQSKFYVEPQPA
jgi:cysteine synthase A